MVEGQQVVKKAKAGDRIYVALAWLPATEDPALVAMGRDARDIEINYNRWLRSAGVRPIRALYVAADPVGLA